MSDFRVGPVGPGAPAVPVAGAGRAAGAQGPGFGEALRKALDDVSALQRSAETAVQDFALGRSRDVAGTLIAAEKASLAFQFTMQIRTKLLDAYHEIMRMSM